MSYKHLSITERELIAIYRELAGNGDNYLPSKAQTRYKRRRKKCRPHKLLEKPDLFKLVKKLFLELQLSPEQKRSTGNRGAIRHLRHRGKPRRPKGYVSNRGKIPIGNELSARPVEALERSRFGDWEVDTIVGYKTAMIEALRGQPLKSVTSDRDREFQLHCEVTATLGVEFYFPPPHQPWQRGTNENTNGLFCKYFPKGYDFIHYVALDLTIQVIKVRITSTLKSLAAFS